MEADLFKPEITPQFIARSLHLKGNYPHPDQPFVEVVGDSRGIRPGSLYVAIRGDRFDGHQFIESAIEQGATGIFCRKDYVQPSNKEVAFFAVEDPLVAYRKLAAAWRKEFSIPFIVVAGSTGKTTTKEFLAAILTGKWKHVLKTQASENGFVGIPKTLFKLTPEHQAAVIEVAIDEVGTMQQHMALLGANAAVLTSIGPEHLEFLKDIPTVAREEGFALSMVAKSGGLVAINLDDPWIRPHLSTLREGRKIPFSLDAEKTSSESQTREGFAGEMMVGSLSEDGNELTFQGLGLKPTQVRMPLLGRHNASNLLAAITVAAGLGLKENEILKGLENFEGAEGRSEIRSLPDQRTIICDYYNANPASMRAGLDLLALISRERRAETSWACIADMLELGPNEEQFHREVATPILEFQIHNVLLYGPRMAFLADELRKRKFAGKCIHFEQQSDLIEHLKNELKPHSVVLVKGSHSMKMEGVWKSLESS